MEISLLTILPVFAAAFLIAFAFTPISISIAKRFGIMDVPKDDRRMHRRMIPRFGGIAIYIATIVPLIFLEWDNPKIRAAIIGGTLIYMLGAADDKFDFRAGRKLLCEIVIAIVMYCMDIKILYIDNYAGPGVWQFNTVLCFVVTIIWIVGITNAINFIDGLDGLAAGISAIVAFSMAYVAYIHGDAYGVPVVCVGLIAIAGACLGFLPYNFSPAKTLMGDGGALFLGFMIAVMSVIGPLKRSTIITVAVPVAALAIPIFDTMFAVIRRLLSGKSIMAPDKGHLHHRLIDSGYGQKHSVLMLYGISGIMGMAAVLISRTLYKDAFVLVAICAIYLYVFLTGTDGKMIYRKKKNDWENTNLIDDRSEKEGDR